MEKPNLKFIVEDGRIYAEVTLRDVLDNCDLSDTPMLAEYKRVYDENDKMRELLGYAQDYISGGEGGCKRCPIFDACQSRPMCEFAEYFNARVAELD